MVTECANANGAHAVAIRRCTDSIIYLIYKVFAQNVVGLTLVSCEGRSREFQAEAVADIEIGRESASVGVKCVFFSTFEEHPQFHWLVEKAEFGAAIARQKIIDVARTVAQKSQLNAVSQVEREICLKINESRIIVARCLKRVEQIFVALVADARNVVETVVEAVAVEHHRAAEKAARSRSAPPCWTLIFNVEH